MIADSGYGSEGNYGFMEANETEPFVKFPMFHKEQKKHSKKRIFDSKSIL
jgi:hypothetical protein